MKISINTKRIEGPYGGGNQFVQNLEKYLLSAGHEVSRELVPGLDLILIVSSRPSITSTSYTYSDIREYLFYNPNTVVVHRINSCDQARAADIGTNKATIEANQIADYTVFVSEFIRDIFFKESLDKTKGHEVIYTGVNEKLFNREGYNGWHPGSVMKIVTHHWSSNYMKGFDIYERLDLLLGKEPFNSIFQFTYVGNTPLGLELKNTQVIKAHTVEDIAPLLKENHVYLTGARFEAGGNHYLEAMRCGLPVLYLESGSNGEYCSQYGGVSFTPIDFEEKLLELPQRYTELSSAVSRCPFGAAKMSEEYTRLFERLVAERRHAPKAKPEKGQVFLYFAYSFGRKSLNKIKGWLLSKLG